MWLTRAEGCCECKTHRILKLSAEEEKECKIISVTFYINYMLN